MRGLVQGIVEAGKQLADNPLLGWVDPNDKQWSFRGPTNGIGDITTEWMNYYETEDEYVRLRKVKTKVDPCNVFRTKMTIPPF